MTAGKHLDGFVELCRSIVVDAGIEDADVFYDRKRILPGHYRAEKNWDIVVVSRGSLVAAVEFKAQVGSFGNNCNNRMEEAIGSATDLWAAYREGAFKESPRPWLGYVFLLEECEKSLRPIRVSQPHFPASPPFVDASYARRYEILLTRLLRDRLYDGAALLLASRTGGKSGLYSIPSEEVSFRRFAMGLHAHAAAFTDLG